MAKPTSLRVAVVDSRAVVRLKSWTPDASSVAPTTMKDARWLNLGPGEWLAVSDHRSGKELIEEVHRTPDGQRRCAAVDLSSAIKTLCVEGPAVREVLGKGCGLDLHPRSFPVGNVARTRFAQLPVVLECTGPDTRFELHVGRSYLQYLRFWLEDAMDTSSV